MATDVSDKICELEQSRGQSTELPSVEVKKAWKSYKKVPCLKGDVVLKGLSMTVPNGAM